MDGADPKIKKYPIIPVPKPKATKMQYYKPTPGMERFFAFRDMVKWSKVELPPFGAHVIFNVPIPKARKDLSPGDPHTQRPDLDNFFKALGDSVYEEDCVVWSV